MAEVVLSSVVEWIIGELGKAAVIARGFEDELGELEGTLTTIKSVLVDAEKQQIKNQQIRTWLGRLEDAVLDADDLVDEISTEALLRQQLMPGNAMDKVLTFFSSSNPIAFRYNMGQNIKDIRQKLDLIADDRQKFNLVLDRQDSKIKIGEWEEHSFERQENIAGRDDDKKAIKKVLFAKETEKNMVVIPIVGAGGLGKTTLAQLVCTDKEVKDTFELIRWVNVPKVFNVKSILKQIVQSKAKDKGSSENMDQLQKVVREKLKGKQYLIVLDDVWESENENISDNWLKLENFLRDGASGSRIIVTTRSEGVARIINGAQGRFHRLNTLDEEKSWSLFKKLAFGQEQEPNDHDLMEVGKQIMKSCGGNPLVIRVIGSMLFSLDRKEWSSFKDEKLLEIPQYKEDIISRLKLSYDNLPSNLKQCFSYCSLFPKNHIFNVEDLINLWIAQGFIQPPNQQKPLEDIGYQYFKVLLYRSFFQRYEWDDLHEDKYCKMHDCMHDLAMTVAGAQSIMVNSNDGNDNKINIKTRHVSFSYDVSPQPILLANAKRIRTILLPKMNESFGPKREGFFHTSVDDAVSLNYKFLRTLEFFGEHVENIPNSIGKLKHLRYLNLSYNKMLKVLPDCITSLPNLQVLRLIRCESLLTLPREITKLVNLRHLDLRDCDKLSHIPSGIGQMINLQSLTQFPLGEKLEDSAQLNDIEHLNNLRGELRIVVKKEGIESKGANLKNKPNLQSLELNIKHKMRDGCDDLLPHSNLKKLVLRGTYVSDVLINHVSSLHNLVRFVLRDHYSCQYVGALNHLQHLEHLKLIDLPALEYICSSEDIGTSSPFLPSLRQLFLWNLPKLKGWWKVENDDSGGVATTNEECTRMPPPFFPRLSELISRGCPNLISMPPFPNLQEHLWLWGSNIKVLEETVKMNNKQEEASSSSFTPIPPPLSNLKELWIIDCSDVDWFVSHLESLVSLRELKIINCADMQALYSCLHHLTSLQRLEINVWYINELKMGNGMDEIGWKHLPSLSHLTLRGLDELVSLPQGLQHATSLQHIEVHYCRNLESVLECISSFKSLKTLSFSDCPKLKSLPEDIDSLTSLQTLQICNCPILLEKCVEDGEFRPKLHHIKELKLAKDKDCEDEEEESEDENSEDDDEDKEDEESEDSEDEESENDEEDREDEESENDEEREDEESEDDEREESTSSKRRRL